MGKAGLCSGAWCKVVKCCRVGPQTLPPTQHTTAEVVDLCTSSDEEGAPGGSGDEQVGVRDASHS